jgi:hypothetical protein
MEEQTEVYLFISPEVQQLLADNQTDIGKLLREQGVQVETRFAQDPTQTSDTGSRELVTVLIASTAIIAVLTPTITNIINALTYKPIIVNTYELVPLEDSHGNVIRDANNQPILVKRSVPQLLQPTPLAPQSTSLTAKIPGIEISVTSNKDK